MELFHFIVILIAIILLILILVGVSYIIKTTNAIGTVYPPVANQCPDQWIADGTATIETSNCIIPDMSYNLVPMANLGTLQYSSYATIAGYFTNPTTGFNEINFVDAGWSAKGTSSICAQKNWANQNGIVWDTVSNYNQC